VAVGAGSHRAGHASACVEGATDPVLLLTPAATLHRRCAQKQQSEAKAKAGLKARLHNEAPATWLNSILNRKNLVMLACARARALARAGARAHGLCSQVPFRRAAHGHGRHHAVADGASPDVRAEPWVGAGAPAPPMGVRCVCACSTPRVVLHSVPRVVFCVAIIAYSPAATAEAQGAAVVHAYAAAAAPQHINILLSI
jgi:hypothetical protein